MCGKVACVVFVTVLLLGQAVAALSPPPSPPPPSPPPPSPPSPSPPVPPPPPPRPPAPPPPHPPPSPSPPAPPADTTADELSLEDAVTFWQGKHLTAVVGKQEPYVFYNPGGCGRDAGPCNALYTGFSVDLTNAILDFLNISLSYDMYLNPDNQLGNLLGTGIWTGVFGEVVYRRAHFSIGPTAINYERAKAVDFSHPFQDVTLRVITQQPPVTPPNYWRFVLPFSLEVWLTLLALLVIIAVVAWVFEAVSPFGFSKSLDRVTRHNYGLGTTLARSMLVIMMLGETRDFGRAWSTRLLMMAHFFFALIVGSTYTASLTAILTIGAPNAGITGLDDLRNGRVPFGVVDQQAPKDFFEDNNAYKYTILTNNYRVYPDFESMITDVRAGVITAAVHFNADLDYVANQAPCNQVVVVGGQTFFTGYAVAFPKGSSLRTLFSQAIIHLRNSGVVDDLTTKWWGVNGACPKAAAVTATDAFSPIGLADVAGVFFLIAIFTGMGGLVLLTEIYCHRQRHRIEAVYQYANQFCGYDSEDDLGDLAEMGVTLEDLERDASEAFRESLVLGTFSSTPRASHAGTPKLFVKPSPSQPGTPSRHRAATKWGDKAAAEKGGDDSAGRDDFPSAPAPLAMWPPGPPGPSPRGRPTLLPALLPMQAPVPQLLSLPSLRTRPPPPPVIASGPRAATASVVPTADDSPPPPTAAESALLRRLSRTTSRRTIPTAGAEAVVDLPGPARALDRRPSSFLERRLSMRPSGRLSAPAGTSLPIAHEIEDPGAEGDTEGGPPPVAHEAMQALEDRRTAAQRRREQLKKLGSFAL